MLFNPSKHRVQTKKTRKSFQGKKIMKQKKPKRKEQQPRSYRREEEPEFEVPIKRKKPKQRSLFND